MIQGIKNLIYWFKTIWFDRDYDQDFIYKNLKDKLRKVSKYLKKYGQSVVNNVTVQRIETCIRLIDKMLTYYYEEEYTTYQKSIMDFSPIPNSPNFTIDVIYLENNLHEYFTKYKNEVRKMKVNIPLDPRGQHRLAFSVARKVDEKARKLLFKIIEENISKWWN